MNASRPIRYLSEPLDPDRAENSCTVSEFCEEERQQYALKQCAETVANLEPDAEFACSATSPCALSATKAKA